jgi:cell division protein FtsA
MLRQVPAAGVNGGEARPPRKNVFGVLDLGSTRFTCMIAESNALAGASSAEDSVKVLGFGQTIARGVRTGAVTNAVEAEQAIRLAVDTAERMAERRIHDVHVNVSGGRAKSEFCTGSVATQTGIVSPRDIENAISAAVTGLKVGRRQVLHLMPAAFALDDVPNDDAPLGLHGNQISVDMAVATVDPAVLNNIKLSVERAHLGLSGFTLSPYAAARGTISADEKKLGALVVDLGGQVTSYAMFLGGRLLFAGALPIGGSHVTQDIAQGLSTTLAHAERMKTLYGSVVPLGHEDREFLAVPLAGEKGTDSVQQVPKHILTSIIRPRLEETLFMVRAAVEPHSRFLNAATKLVLTGGGSLVHGAEVLAGEVFGLNARVGAPRVATGLPAHAKNAGSCVVAGLAASAAYPERQYAMPREAQAAIDRASLSYARRVGRWLAESL